MSDLRAAASQSRLRGIRDYHAPHREKWGDEATDMCADCFLLALLATTERQAARIAELEDEVARLRRVAEAAKAVDAARSPALGGAGLARLLNDLGDALTDAPGTGEAG